MCKGRLRKDLQLCPRTLVDMLTNRYKWPDDDARAFADFLLPMMTYDPRRRATADQCLRHPWLRARQPTPPPVAADRDSVEVPLPLPSSPPPPPPSDSAVDEPSPMADASEIDADVPALAAADAVAKTRRDATTQTRKDDVLP